MPYSLFLEAGLGSQKIAPQVRRLSEAAVGPFFPLSVNLSVHSISSIKTKAAVLTALHLNMLTRLQWSQLGSTRNYRRQFSLTVHSLTNVFVFTSAQVKIVLELLHQPD